MVIFLKIPLILLFLLVFSGCFGKGTYDIATDKAILDMDTDIEMLSGELKKIKEDAEKVKKALEDINLDSELREGAQKELFESDYWQKKLFEMIAYRKIKKRQRLESLNERKEKGEDFGEQAKKEVDAYFLHKELHPIKKDWEMRFRSAIDI